MQEDPRMVELLSDLLHEVKGLNHRIENLESEQKRTTNGIWELSQMLQKVVWEPQHQMAGEIADIKRRVEVLEHSQK